MSASAPAGSASSITGKLSAASTSATSDGDDESEVINQPAPTSCIHEPTFETIVAIHRLRKSVLWSGLHGEVATAEETAPADGAAGEVFTGLAPPVRAWPPRLRRLQQPRSSKLQHELVDVAPAPILPGLERSHDRMFGRMIMLGGVLVLRIVAAADVPAGPAQAKMHPGVAAREAFLAAIAIAPVGRDELEMIAAIMHGGTLSSAGSTCAARLRRRRRGNAG